MLRTELKIIPGPKEAFTDFLQRLTLAVNRIIPNSEAIQIILKSLLFENANSLCKRIIKLLKARSAPLEECIWDSINIESHDHDDAWKGVPDIWRKIKISSVTIVANKVTLKVTVNRMAQNMVLKMF